MSQDSVLQKHASQYEPKRSVIGIIGGSGFGDFGPLRCLNNQDVAPSRQRVETPYGYAEDIMVGELASAISTTNSTTANNNITTSSSTIVFMPRHGHGHRLPPHKINYRANIWALKSLGVTTIIAINAVGGIGERCVPGAIVIPDQLIDYTYGRDQTYADILTDDINHIDFGLPYEPEIRIRLLTAAERLGLAVEVEGCYACTQGPRLETAAEVQRLKRDGNTLVGMTAMPEAALAKELGLAYASICIVANWGAGLSSEPISLADIHRVLDQTTDKVKELLVEVLGDW